MDFFYNRILQTEDYKQVEQDLISIVKDFSPYDTTLIINITKKLLASIVLSKPQSLSLHREYISRLKILDLVTYRIKYSQDF